ERLGTARERIIERGRGNALGADALRTCRLDRLNEGHPILDSSWSAPARTQDHRWGGNSMMAVMVPHQFDLAPCAGGVAARSPPSVELTPSGRPTTVMSRPPSSRRLATRLASAKVTESIRAGRRSM